MLSQLQWVAGSEAWLRHGVASIRARSTRRMQFGPIFTLRWLVYRQISHRAGRFRFCSTILRMYSRHMIIELLYLR